jgi:AcrR family transcriptional regulator
MIRDAILAAAERVFEAHGYDNVTVAQIAYAANVSVKTLFVYFRSKEDLAFADTSLIDALTGALRDRAPGVTPAAAIGAALHEQARMGSDIEGYHRLVGDSVALQSRLLRLWAEYEDALVGVLGVEPTPRDRLVGAQLVAVVRSLTMLEVRAAVAAGATDEDRRVILPAWIDEAVALID